MLSTPPHSRRRRIALLLNDLSHSYQTSFLASIEKAARRHDLDLLVILGRETEHPEAQERVQNVLYTDWLSPAAADGAVVLAAALSNHCGSQRLRELCLGLHPLPVSSIGLAIPGVPSVVIDNQRGMQRAVEHLIQVHRRRRIVYLSGPTDNPEAQARRAGYEAALAAAGLRLDPDLVEPGAFTAQSGQEAMRRVLARTRDFDALVGANDYMAMGGMEVLRESGFAIAEDVLVLGFDDSPVARFAPRSLTSVAQPTDLMADHAVGALLASFAGKAMPSLTAVNVELVLRESCGCGYVVVRDSLFPEAHAPGSARRFLEQEREHLLAQLLPQSASHRSCWLQWAERLLSALARELDGQTASFLREVDRLCEEASAAEVPLDEIGAAISVLRTQFQNAGFRFDAQLDLERLWMKAMAIQAAAVTRLEGRRALEIMTAVAGLRRANQRLSVALDPFALSSALDRSLDELGVELGLMALKVPNRDELVPAYVRSKGRSSTEQQPYAVNQLLPSGFPGTQQRWSVMLFALNFEEEVQGVVAFDASADVFVCEALRSQLSGSLRLREMHARVVEATALRERLSRQQLVSELSITSRIQTALAPRAPRVSGLSIAATLQPADELGGDYYDVIATPDGCWLGIGDVSGHGLLSSLIMMMIQSMVSALVRVSPDADAATLLCELNATLVPNLRERLMENEFATLMLLRYRQDGSVQFSGAHEEPILYRAATRRAELVPAPGVWIGIRPDIRDVTSNQSLLLTPGDILVLYTDGVSEAQNANAEQFGPQRIAQIVEDNAARPVALILERILSSLRSWSPAQRDDVTCIVARYEGNPSAS